MMATCSYLISSRWLLVLIVLCLTTIYADGSPLSSQISSSSSLSVPSVGQTPGILTSVSVYPTVSADRPNTNVKPSVSVHSTISAETQSTSVSPSAGQTPGIQTSTSVHSSINANRPSTGVKYSLSVHSTISTERQSTSVSPSVGQTPGIQTSTSVHSSINADRPSAGVKSSVSVHSTISTERQSTSVSPSVEQTPGIQTSTSVHSSIYADPLSTGVKSSVSVYSSMYADKPSTSVDTTSDSKTVNFTQTMTTHGLLKTVVPTTQNSLPAAEATIYPTVSGTYVYEGTVTSSYSKSSSLFSNLIASKTYILPSGLASSSQSMENSNGSTVAVITSSSAAYSIPLNSSSTGVIGIIPTATLKVETGISTNVVNISTSYPLSTPIAGVANSTAVESGQQTGESSYSMSAIVRTLIPMRSISAMISSTSVCNTCGNIFSLSTRTSVMSFDVSVPIITSPPSVSQVSSIVQTLISSSSHHSSASLWSSMVLPASTGLTSMITCTASATSTTTPAEGPTAPPQNVLAHNTSSTNIYVSWQSPPPCTLNGILKHYEVIIRKAVSPTFAPPVTPTITLSRSNTNTIGSVPSLIVIRPTGIVTRSIQNVTPLISVTHYGSSSIVMTPTPGVPTIPTEPTGEPTEHPEALLAPLNAGLSLNITVRNLEKWTVYEVLVRAVTEIPGPLSAVVTVRTDEDVPSAPRNLSVAAINSSAMAVEWKSPMNPNGVLLGYLVSYRVTGSQHDTRTSVGVVQSHVITNLSPYTVYSIQVTARTRKGHGNWVSVSAQTPEGRPSHPRNVTATVLNSTAITIAWAQPQYPNGRIRYRVYIRSASQDHSANKIKYDDTGTVFVASGLDKYTSYVFTVIAFNFNNANLFSQSVVVEGTTYPTQPSGPPVDVRVLIVSSSSVLVKWSPPPVQDTNGPILKYLVEYYTTTGPHEIRNTTDNTTSLLVTSLSPYTLYYFIVRTVNVIGVGPASEIVSNTTYEAAPSPPTQVRATSANATSIRVTWYEPEKPNGALIKYRLYYRLASQSAGANRRAYDGEDTTYLVVGLEEYDVYLFTVMAYNVKYGLNSSVVTVNETTHPAEPSGSPRNVSAISISSHSIRVQWQPPKASEINGRLTWYVVFHNKSLGPSVNITVDSNTTAVLVDQLRGYMVYYFTVQALNEVGAGPASTPIYSRTLEDIPEAPLLNEVRNLSATVLQVSWNLPTIPNGVIAAFSICWVPHLAGNATCTQTDGSARLFNITHLLSYSFYNISIAASTSVGYGPVVSGVYKTDEGVPGAVASIIISSRTNRSLRVEWSPPNQPNGIIGYMLYYWPTINHTQRLTILVPHGNLSHWVSGLDPYVSYTISVIPYNVRKHFKGPARKDTARTLAALPEAPVLNEVRNLSATVLQVSWNLPTIPNGVIAAFSICWVPHLAGNVTCTQTDGSARLFNITHLLSYSFYNISIAASTSVGYGPVVSGVYKTDEGVPDAVASTIISSRTNRSLRVEWSPPNQPNGIIGYMLYYWPTINHTQRLTIVVPHGNLSHWVSGLDPYVSYTISVIPYNLRKHFKGPARKETARTLAAPPSGPPVKVTLSEATPYNLIVQWDPPAKPNGEIVGYLLVIYDKEKPAEKDDHQTASMKYTLTGLRPWHEYAVQVACRSSGGLGPLSAPSIFKTKPSEPPTIGTIKPPDNKDVSTHEIVVELVEASNANGKISYYQIVVLELQRDSDGMAMNPPYTPDHYKPDALVTYDEARKRKPELVPYITGTFKASEFERRRRFTVGKGNDTSARKRRDTDKYYYNGPLSPATYYTVFQRAHVSKDLYTSGAWIKPVSTSEVATAAPRMLAESNTGLVAGLSITFVGVIIVILVVVFLWRRRRFDFGVMLDDNGEYTAGRSLKLRNLRKRRTSSKGLMGSTDSIDAIDELSRNRRRRQPIPVETFEKHVRRMHIDGDIGYSEEYELVQPNDEEYTWQHSLHPTNKFKNRYANIVAYDHSRVLLAPVEGLQESEYINANYVDGYNRSGAYIATQGPLPDTFDDFWRMVWEQGSAVIVMLTQLEERGRRKCDQYWPERGTRNYGVIRVTASETFHMSYYVLRTFILSHKKEEEEPRQVKHYHFTSWPDHGVPSHSSPLLSMVRTVAHVNPVTAGPMVIHCSAGVGRTGTFITLDSMLQRIAQEGTLDVYGFVKQMRAKRNLMVQTEAQYVFIHDALVEAVICGVTEVEAKRFASHIRELREVDPNTGHSYMDKEFERLVKDERHPSTFKNANLGCNSTKNRYANIMPYERTRVQLNMRPGEVGSDYINASYVDGYCHLKAYIATQAPVPNTFEDFWRMIWEQNSSVIVMLTREEEGGKLRCHRYWPSDSSRLYHTILVELAEEVTYCDYVVRKFSLTHTEEKKTRTVRHFQYTDWPDNGLPESGVGIVDLIGQVEKWQQQSGNTCITVHCSGGVGRTGVFCAVSTTIERVKAEGVIDIFQTVQNLRLQRPAMVQTKDQYEFCYTTIQEYLESFELYANFQ